MVTQPDGSTVRVRNNGDHLQHWTSTVKGNYTVVKGNDGAWHYASGLTSSGALRPSNVVAGSGAAPAAAQDLAPAPIAQTTPNKAPLGGTGDDTELVILTQFSDVTHKASGSTEADWANHYFGATGSVDDFYEEATQNQFGLKPAKENCGTADNGVVDWITLPMTHPNTGTNPNATEQYVADAISMASSCVDFAQFDTNSDHELTTDELHVTVIGAGYEESYGSGCAPAKSIWGHQWDLASAGIAAPTVDGVKVGNSGYTTFGEWHCRTSDTPGHKATIGIMAHEFGHDINWPDLYDTSGNAEGLGEFSLMAGGSWGGSKLAGHLAGDSPAWPDAFALYYQGWITPTVATSGSNDVTLAPHQALLLGPNPGGTDWLFNESEGNGEYFLAENRSHQGYDQSTPGCGIVIYRVDETVTPSNSANNGSADPLVKVIQADGLDELTTGHNDRGDTGDPWPGSTANHDLTNTSTPNSKFHDAVASNLNLHVDDQASNCASSATVDVNTVGGASTPVVRPANDMFANAVTISGLSGTTTGNSAHATTEPGEPKPAGAGRASVWYRWTAPASGATTISMAGSDYDTVLGIYTGSAVGGLTEVAANDDENNPGGIYTSKVQFRATAGTTYQIAADGYGGDSGAVKLTWSTVPDATPTKMATTTAATAPHKVKFKQDFDVTANVTAGATGTVTVMEGTKVLGTGTLSNGTVKIHITKNLKPGKHTLTVSYGGSATHLASSTTVKVKVQKKKKHHHH